MDFYEDELYRKLKFSKYRSRQRSEMNMINNFKKIYGTPKETIIGIGDWEQSLFKYHEPTKGKGIRKIFRNAGYQIFLVDEHKTSCRCSKCQGECSTFRKCFNPRPYTESVIYRHGLVRCTTCHRIWNRDDNASKNILKIMKEEIFKNRRPKYLSRKHPKDDSSITSSVSIERIKF